MMSCIETINSRYFTGAGVALVTPFDENQEIDFGALGALLDHVNAAQIDYLVVMGTTAEAPTITHQEKQAVLDFCTKNNHRNIPIVMGIGGNSTAAVIQAIESFDLSKASGILSITPYYNKPTQEGLLAHFSAIAQSSPIPIILYNVPGRTGVNMSAETTLTLAHKYPQKIVAIKEASAQINQIAKILRDRPVGFSVISGDDTLALPLIAMGCDGVISVACNVFAQKNIEMIHLAQKGEIEEAAKLHLELLEATELLFAEGNPAGVKAALELKGITKETLRLPLVRVSESLKEKIAQQIKKYNL